MSHYRGKGVLQILLRKSKWKLRFMKKTGIFYRSEPENLSDFMMKVIVVLDF